jgi:hypothetical protein
VPRHFLFSFFFFACLILLGQELRAEGLVTSRSHFYYRNAAGGVSRVRIIRHYYQPVVHANATIDPRLSPALRRAVSIAEERASAHTKGRCWQYVKEALVAAHAIPSYPKTAYACDAGEELMRDFGFKRLPIHDPYAAPLGAVLVYGRGSRGSGHIELRTKTGFVSDYHSKWKCFYPLLAVYGKFS